MHKNNLKTAEIKDKLVEIIATGIYEYIKITEHDPQKTYIPADKEEIIRKYQNEALFCRVVDCIAYSILNHLTS